MASIQAGSQLLEIKRPPVCLGLHFTTWITLAKKSAPFPHSSHPITRFDSHWTNLSMCSSLSQSWGPERWETLIGQTQVVCLYPKQGEGWRVTSLIQITWTVGYGMGEGWFPRWIELLWPVEGCVDNGRTKTPNIYCREERNLPLLRA